jgi:hypothetical protein
LTLSPFAEIPSPRLLLPLAVLPLNSAVLHILPCLPHNPPSNLPLASIALLVSPPSPPPLPCLLPPLRMPDSLNRAHRDQLLPRSKEPRTSSKERAAPMEWLPLLLPFPGLPPLNPSSTSLNPLLPSLPQLSTTRFRLRALPLLARPPSQRTSNPLRPLSRRLPSPLLLPPSPPSTSTPLLAQLLLSPSNLPPLVPPLPPPPPPPQLNNANSGRHSSPATPLTAPPSSPNSLASQTLNNSSQPSTNASSSRFERTSALLRRR